MTLCSPTPPSKLCRTLWRFTSYTIHSSNIYKFLSWIFLGQLVLMLLTITLRLVNFTEANSLCDNTNVYIFTSDTTIIKHTNRSATKLKVRGCMFLPRCSHLQANLYRSSTFNVRTKWGPIMCTIMIQTAVKNIYWWIKYIIIWFWSHLSQRIKSVVKRAHTPSTHW